MKILSRNQWWIITSGVLLLLAYYSVPRFLAYTSDAYVSANVVSIGANISGPVVKVMVVENQALHKGDPILQIDPKPYEYAIDKAQAQLDLTKQNYRQLIATIASRKSVIAARESELASAKNDYERIVPLVKRNEFAASRAIDLQNRYKTAKALLYQASFQLQQDEALFTSEMGQNNPIKIAQAQLDKAKYNLQQTIVRAPTDGYLTNFNLRSGSYLKPGSFVGAFIDTSVWWIIARYKETYLANIHPGSKAKISIDMYPGFYQGVVLNIGWGINQDQASPNASKSPLIYLTPTEDWIRLAQRFPVRIKILNPDPNKPLRVGANARVFILL